MLKIIIFFLILNYNMLKLRYNIEKLPKKVIMTDIAKKVPEYSLIWLHGLGSSPDEFVDFFNLYDILPDNFRIILLQAPIKPVTLNGGMNSTSWFDIIDLSFGKNSVNFSDVEESSKRVMEEIEEELKIVKESKNVFLGGFSQGAMVSLNVGVTLDKQLGGVIACSGFLFLQDQINNNELPILASHGDYDDIVRYDRTVKSYKKLQEDFENFKFLTMIGQGHTINYDVIKNMKEFINKYTGK